MFSRPLAFLLLALGCVTAAAGGAYLATRHNATDETTVAAMAPQASAPQATTAADPAAQPVAETEAAVTTPTPPPVAEAAPPPAPRRVASAPAPAPRRQERAPARPATASVPQRDTRVDASVPQRTAPANGSAQPVQPESQPVTAAVPPPPAPELPRPIEPQPEAPRPPQFEEVILPASSVIGLQIESALSSERARPEDRVEARVTRDVMAAGRVAIPAGSRVVGSVTLVEKGGKVKEPGRLGVRFHTVVLGDGSEVPLQTELITRTGESPTGKSAKKIGGAAVGGAILGAILGGGKGAAIGAGAGAGAGTAAVMAGDRAAATLRQGEIINARLTSPATITVERRQQ